MSSVIVVGAGGHGHVVADVLRSAGEMVLGFVDDHPDRISENPAWPVLGRVQDLGSIDHDTVVVAVGDNETRLSVVTALPSGEVFVAAVHPAATVSVDTRVEAGAMLCPGVVVNLGAVIGAHAIVNTSATVDHHCIVGPYAHIAPGAHLGGGVSVGEGALIGMGSSLLPGVRVGKWARVGAGAVVLEDVPDGVTVVGAPAALLHGETPR